ncbi:hypothetical protein [Streptomyces sp. enrichment culture]|uniref:hypothetical protein n=1 Tax=Streptomyces sp. enrichment culture TaxID=1795815 RepID=UPI003F573CFF
MDLHAWITQQVDETESEGRAMLLDPTPLRLRCEADRRILNRHQPQPDGTPGDDGWQCRTCSEDGGDGYQYLVPYPCPTVTDLAHAHGITDDILASLDWPTPPEPQPRDGRRLGLGDTRATPPITTSQVPAALRGPRWTP